MSGGRPRIVRSIKSYVNAVDNTTFAGPMKTGLPPRVGVIKYYHDFYMNRCNQDPSKPKKSYDNMVFLNINSAQTPVPEGFTPTCNYNYHYNHPKVNTFNPNQKFNRHFFSPYKFQEPMPNPNGPGPSPQIYSKALRKLYQP
jgi:hypothetical protein